MSHRFTTWSCFVLSCIALVLSVLAIIVRRPSESDIEARVYQRALNEVWSEAEPTFRSLGLPVKKPNSFTELFHPLFAMGQLPPPSVTRPGE